MDRNRYTTCVYASTFLFFSHNLSFAFPIAKPTRADPPYSKEDTCVTRYRRHNNTVLFVRTTKRTCEKETWQIQIVSTLDAETLEWKRGLQIETDFRRNETFITRKQVRYVFFNPFEGYREFEHSSRVTIFHSGNRAMPADSVTESIYIYIYLFKEIISNQNPRYSVYIIRYKLTVEEWSWAN